MALVTGGGTGIGASAATVLREQGWEVVICGRRRGCLDAVAERTGAIAFEADVASPEDVRRLVADTVARFDRLDGVVLNAGIVRPGGVGELSDDDWDAMIATNLTGPFHVARAALPHLVETHGSLVGVASAAALRATAAIAGYNTTKAGLTMLMQSVAVDYGPSGVRANIVCPGWTRTEMADMEMTELGSTIGVSMDHAYALATAFAPSRRPAEADEIGQVIGWLLSPSASYVNAAVIPVDGGLIAVEPGQIAFDPRVSVRTMT
ncbi:MAG TPA: SDR family oxidoreductase [Amycolatopsis sp.]|uniref:SDR family NAD(P)-dependent oxidoreductase n=1 Tax=Amycolatopsis sp. TaxID=37632 RepID=UPI002B4A1560|nr:SDR family oxidoreductase [Amycolatopsis sp.]HKS44591.1 SDR family oxidoreductase [Amycolatopsis sp.]